RSSRTRPCSADRSRTRRRSTACSPGSSGSVSSSSRCGASRSPSRRRGRRPLFIVVAFVLLLLLPWPAAVIAFPICLLIGAGEIPFWWRRSHRWRVRAGAETMIGERARVVQACRPLGQVSISGELWQARCDAGADEGDSVVVVRREGLVLVVEHESGT